MEIEGENSLKKKYIFKFIVLVILCVFALDLSPSVKTLAMNLQKEDSKEVENILKEIIEEYGEENIIFDTGIYLEVGEKINEDSLDYSINWKAYDNSILEKEDYFLGIKKGSSFLIGEYENKFIVKEVCVYEKEEDTQVNAAYNKSGQPLVYIDPGHGGLDPGAGGNGIIEKHYVLDLSLRVKEKLEAKGIKVVMTREDDRFVSLNDRAVRANNLRADAFVSIHANAARSTAYGIETFYYKNIDNSLASSIQKKLINYTKAYNRGVKNNNFYVVKYTNMPAALAEVGFMTNKDEAEKLKTYSYQEKLVNAIANGILERFGESTSDEYTSFNVERLYSSDRYETSYSIFRKGWTSSSYAVLASGTDYPDALCATPLAAKYNAPILLVSNNSLENQKSLKAILKEKGVTDVFIVGGKGAVPETFEEELLNEGISSKRLSGANRYGTSIAIAKEVGLNNGEVFLVSGMSFADGLSISSIAGKKVSPIILSKENSLPEESLNYVIDNNDILNKGYIIGSTGVISDDVLYLMPNAERIGGSNRFETNKNILDKFISEIDLNNIYMASGINFPDALSVSALASKDNNFVILSNITSSDVATKNLISENKNYLKNIFVIGSNSIISDNLLNKYGIY